jgi:hypothetical protein
VIKTPLTLFDIDDDIDKGATLSKCRTWRYALWRKWDVRPESKMVAFIGLNPSTADESNDDPTIRRCKGFAKRWGFGGMYMLNAYAFRATEPKDMIAARDPVGDKNYHFICEYSKLAELVVACWGVHCDSDHGHSVCRSVGKTVMCLGKTKHNRPKHPLYLKSDTSLEVFWEPWF